MSLFDSIKKKLHNTSSENADFATGTHEFCPRCEANLTLQKGYSNELPYWVCRGCGEMLINPAIDTDTTWICDGCGTMLNIQDGFTEETGEWKCLECGFVNPINEENLYLSEDEYQAELNSPYKGLSDEDLLWVTGYEEVEELAGRQDICVVRDEGGRLFVRKFLRTYDKSVYDYLMEHPIDHMPRVVAACEGDNCLVVIEEYISGRTLEQSLCDGVFETEDAVRFVLKLAYIAKELHSQTPPIIHRDIKPSNVMIMDNGEIILLDVNVAKWMREDESQDTQLLGSMHYAAPEQFGYGFTASTAKTDVFALGVLLNVMITGKLPTEEKATGVVWNVIERCMKLDVEARYTDDELIDALISILR